MGRSKSTMEPSGAFGGRSARGQSEQMGREVQIIGLIGMLITLFFYHYLSFIHFSIIII